MPNGAATVKTQIEAAKEVGISRRTDDEPPTLRQAVRLTAKLGGFLGRKCDGEPGTKALWLGLQRLDDIAGVYQFMAPFVVPHPQDPPVSSDSGCG